jgi:hypothetical protein
MWFSGSAIQQTLTPALRRGKLRRARLMETVWPDRPQCHRRTRYQAHRFHDRRNHKGLMSFLRTL